ncbi:hypothetical protein TNCV_873961 [Trichonephila clavipes]|nr:hypothetical protein TNCV_873961 [Trichonephila clavipes]
MMYARTCPCQAAYSNASGFLGRVTSTTVVEMSSGRHRFGPSCSTDVMCRDDSSFIVSNRMLAEPSVANHSCIVFKPITSVKWD